ncbi:MAG: 30S ribosomal protein S1 [Calditrichaeota bacterium]|nr:30S ribosomal protein S1 [Calditrichota bacterium]
MTEEVKPQTPANSGKKADDGLPFQPGQVVKLEDLDKIMSEAEHDRKELQDMYDESFSQFKQEEIVKGKILDIGSNFVVVDIGFKSEGMLPLEEFIDIHKFKVGDEVELFLESQEDKDGNVQVSRRKVYFLRTWDRLMKAQESGEILQGRIVRRIKGGFVVDLDGVDAFLPGSQVDVKPIRDFDAFVGGALDMKIVKVNEQRKNIVVSRRVIIEKELESKREEILSTLEKGQVRRGVVKNITDFGVFIDLGGVDGLLHITDLSWGRVNHPSELVDLDQEIDVMILDFDEKKSRISLGLKQLKPHPWENIAERFPIGSKVTGKVVSLTDYGAFIELEHGIEGLIHVSEMSWSHHIKNPSQILKVGDDVEAVLLSIEPEERKISLGLKQLSPDPWEDIETKFPVDSKHRGVVRNLTPFGAFVELEEGVDGLVHISDLSWTRKVRHPSEVIRKGEEIDVVVLDINKDERRIALGHKQVDANPWDAFEDAYEVGTEVLDGKIVRLIDKGVIVGLPLGVDAFVPLRELGIPGMKRASDHFKVGDEVPLKVIEFDKDNKRIVLSATEYLKDKEREVVDSYMAEHASSAPTLKEMVDEVPEMEESPEEGKGRKAPAKKKAKDEEAEAAEATETETAEAEETEKAEEVETADETPEAEEAEADAPAETETAEEPATEAPEAEKTDEKSDKKSAKKE